MGFSYAVHAVFGAKLPDTENERKVICEKLSDFLKTGELFLREFENYDGKRAIFLLLNGCESLEVGRHSVFVVKGKWPSPAQVIRFHGLLMTRDLYLPLSLYLVNQILI